MSLFIKYLFRSFNITERHHNLTVRFYDMALVDRQRRLMT